MYDYLRLLFARLRQTFCIKCGILVRRDNPEQSPAQVPVTRPAALLMLSINSKSGSAPPTSGRRVFKKKTPPLIKKPCAAALSDIQKRGFNRLYQDGRLHEFSSPETLLEDRFCQNLSGSSSIGWPSTPRRVLASSTPSKSAIAKATAKHLEFVPDAGNPANASSSTIASSARMTAPSIRSLSRACLLQQSLWRCPRCQASAIHRLRPQSGRPRSSKSLDDGAIEPGPSRAYRVLFQEAKKFARAQGIPPTSRGVILPRPASAYARGRSLPAISLGQRLFQLSRAQEYKLHVRVF